MSELPFSAQLIHLFAALVLIAATGVVFFAATNALARAALARWHESELPAAD